MSDGNPGISTFLDKTKYMFY